MGTIVEKRMVEEWVKHTALMDDLFKAHISLSTIKELQRIAVKHGFENIQRIDQISAVIGRHNADIEGLEGRWAGYIGKRRLVKDYGIRAKRLLVDALNLKGPSVSYKDKPVVQYVRDASDTVKVKRWSHLVDKGNEDLLGKLENYYVVDGESHNWLTIDTEESAAVIDPEGNLELFVLRNVTNCEDVLRTINTAIDEAIRDRRGVRPTDPGKQVQFGYNAGPRHLRVFGLVHNFASKKWSADDKAQKDRKILGIMSLFWNLVLSHAPKEAVDIALQELESTAMPPMAAESNQDLRGYTFCLDNGVKLEFSNAPRAPPEGYIAANYSSWQTYYDIDGVTLQQGEVPGGNFIDFTLGVRVESSADCLMVFKPQHYHGTTLSREGVCRAGLLTTFSSRIKEAFDKAAAMESELVEISLHDGEEV